MHIFSLQKLVGAATISTFLVGATFSVQAQTPAPTAVQGKTEILWLGQAGFRIKSPGGKIIVIDPWLTGGPKTPPIYKNDIAALGPVDLLLVTHAHVDHIGEAPDLAKLHKTQL